MNANVFMKGTLKVSRPKGARARALADLYALVHRNFGPVSTFGTREDAKQELDDVLRDEPTWADDLWIEPFVLVVEGERDSRE
jgi:hypothetical protein